MNNEERARYDAAQAVARKLWWDFYADSGLDYGDFVMRVAVRLNAAIADAVAAERARVLEAIKGVANALPADVDDGFYAGYKLGIANALGAVRAGGE